MSRFFLKTSLSIILVFAITVSCKKQSTNPNVVYNPQYKDAILESRQSLMQVMHTSFIPGASISVSLNGELVWSQGFGFANKELNAPSTRHTRYRIGSTTHLFTTTLLAKLYEEGTIDIDESFFNYIPQFPLHEFDFTPRMLATHTAGYPFANSRNISRMENVNTFREYISQIEDIKLLYIPNTNSDFSDFNIALLALLAEHVTGKFYHDLLNEMIIDSLGLENTLPDNQLMIIPNRSNSYSLDYIARLINTPEFNLRPFLPVHGLLSSAEDINLFVHKIFETAYFKPETLELFTNGHQLQTGRTISRSFGWLVSKDNKERPLLAFVGNTIGGASTVVYYPEQKLVVTICANKGDDISELPSNLIAQIFLKHIYGEVDFSI